MKCSADPSQEIGMDGKSYAFDGICVSYKLVELLCVILFLNLLRVSVSLFNLA